MKSATGHIKRDIYIYRFFFHSWEPLNMHIYIYSFFFIIVNCSLFVNISSVAKAANMLDISLESYRASDYFCCLKIHAEMAQVS